MPLDWSACMKAKQYNWKTIGRYKKTSSLNRFWRIVRRMIFNHEKKRSSFVRPFLIKFGVLKKVMYEVNFCYRDFHLHWRLFCNARSTVAGNFKHHKCYGALIYRRFTDSYYNLYFLWDLRCFFTDIDRYNTFPQAQNSIPQ